MQGLPQLPQFPPIERVSIEQFRARAWRLPLAAPDVEQWAMQGKAGEQHQVWHEDMPSYIHHDGALKQ